MWLYNQPLPDVMKSVRPVARYIHAPKIMHWKAALNVLLYVRFTSSYCISFRGGTPGGLVLAMFVDSDLASRATDRRFVSSDVIMCTGACVFYYSRMQNVTLLSSTEAEYVAMAGGLKEAIFLQYTAGNCILRGAC